MTEPTPSEISEAARAMGKKGGKARAENLTPERRREIAALGGRKRWAAARKKKVRK